MRWTVSHLPYFMSDYIIYVLILMFQIIGARHLAKTKKFSSPYVEVEIVGAEYDSHKVKTEPCRK